MLYLLDANTLIDAKRDYYPIERIPEFWEWLIFMGEQGVIKIPIEVYEEFSDTKGKDGKKDELAAWSERPEVLLKRQPGGCRSRGLVVSGPG